MELIIPFSKCNKILCPPIEKQNLKIHHISPDLVLLNFLWEFLWLRCVCVCSSDLKVLYCSWWFDIYFQCDRRKDTWNERSEIKPRNDGRHEISKLFGKAENRCREYRGSKEWGLSSSSVKPISEIVDISHFQRNTLARVRHFRKACLISLCLPSSTSMSFLSNTLPFCLTK